MRYLQTLARRLISATRPYNNAPSSSPGGRGYSGHSQSVKPSKPFNPQRVLILTKLSRYEFERLRHQKGLQQSSSGEELEGVLRRRGSDYNTLLYHHYIHKGSEFRVLKAFQDRGVETRLVNRFEYTQENIDWADLIVTTGGDGTFLMAACRIQDRQKPIIGFNTDPTRSIGYLCLPKKYSISVQDAVSKLFENKFRWTLRRRIRITLIGDEGTAFQSPVELHDQQLSQPEYRFFECLQEKPHSLNISDELEKNSKLKRRTLPVLSLNEVYFGECVSARVSYFEVSINSSEKLKTKNSGICVCTGTGSTSWSHNISKISSQTVKELLSFTPTDSGNPPLSTPSEDLINTLVDKYNKSLSFPPEGKEMLYTIRDPVTSSMLPYATEIAPRGYSSKLEIKSRCFDACMVIDGGLSFKFNDGTTAILEMFEEDVLKTVVELDEEEEEDDQGESENGESRKGRKHPNGFKEFGAMPKDR